MAYKQTAKESKNMLVTKTKKMSEIEKDDNDDDDDKFTFIGDQN